MKHLSTLLVISLTLGLTSCSIDWNDEKDKKITALESKIQSDIFQKNQECSKHRAELEEKQTQYDSRKTKVSAVFYSPSLSTCIGKIEETSYGRDWAYLSTIYLLENLFTWETITVARDGCWKDDSCHKAFASFEAKVKELKWE